MRQPILRTTWFCPLPSVFKVKKLQGCKFYVTHLITMHSTWFSSTFLRFLRFPKITDGDLISWAQCGTLEKCGTILLNLGIFGTFGTLYIWLSIFFKKICFIRGTFGTFGTLYLSLYILLKSWNNSWELRDLLDLICMAILFFFNCFTGYRDLRNLGDLISISLDLTKNLEPFLGPSGPYIYGYLFFKEIVGISGPSGPSGPHMYLSRSY